MPKFKIRAAQGELTFERIGDAGPASKIPAGYTPMVPENGRLIIGHSETGHFHVMEPGGVDVAVMDRPPEGMRILLMIVKEPKELKHLRDFDTHEPLMFEPGEYEARIQREYDPYEQLARQVAD